MCKMITKSLLFTITAVLLSASAALALYSQPASTLAGGGGAATSASYSNLGVISQPGVVGSSDSAVYKADHGFFPVLGGWHILYPVISATPGSLTFTLMSGSSDSQSVAVSNAGGSTLKWSVAKGNASETYFSVLPASGTGNASVTVTANAAGLAAGNYSDTLTVSGTGISQTLQVQLTLNVSPAGTYRLTMIVVSDTPLKGGGLVYNVASGISCSNTGTDPNTKIGVCQADIPAGTTLTLIQTPDSNSTYASWTGPCTPSGNNCTVTTNGATDVTATFPYAYMAKVDSTTHCFDSLTGALADAGTTDTILARDVTFTGDLTINKIITLTGGLSPWYLPLNSWTTLQGLLSIQSGSLTVERLVIK
jgi:hypothetical protein